MKLRKIKFKSHPILKDLEVGFEDEKGKILNTVVFIGNNGSGKTSILRGIFENLKNGSVDKNVEADIMLLSLGENILAKIPKNAPSEYHFIHLGIRKGNIVVDEMDAEAKTIGKIVFMPTEINFALSEEIDTRKRIPDSFSNIIDQKITSELSSFIATKIETAVFENEDLPVKESIRKICDSINEIFACMDLEVRIVGLSKDDKKQPVFENKNKDTFPIESLSSGEKQLFLRALSLKFLNVNDSIILIDEPEISLHPEWQRKIISVYESIGTNNQLIVATHSPHVIGDIRKEQLRVLNRENHEIRIMPMDDVDPTYGQTIETILTNNMGLEGVRNDELQFKLEQIQELLRNDEILENDEFQTLMKEVTKHLDDSDTDMALINAQIRRIKMRGAKNNVEN